MILLHGAVNASQHMMKLGRALADAFTVYDGDVVGAETGRSSQPRHGSETGGERQRLSMIKAPLGRARIYVRFGDPPRRQPLRPGRSV